MRKENRVEENRKSKTPEHQSRASLPLSADRRGLTAKAPPAIREFMAESVERAANRPDLESALGEMESLHGIVQHVPGLEKEAALLRGAKGITALLGTIREPGYCGGRGPTAEKDNPTDWVEVTIPCALDDIRFLIQDCAHFQNSRASSEGQALAEALESHYPADDKFPVWSELLSDAKSVDARVSFKPWRAQLVFVVPSHPWRAKICALQLENHFLRLEKVSGW